MILGEQKNRLRGLEDVKNSSGLEDEKSTFQNGKNLHSQSY